MNVLIANESPSRQTAIYSFCGALGVCLILCLSWWLMRPETPVQPLQRRLSDLDLRWRCPNGHEFTRKGSSRTAPCPECGRRADVVAQYLCPEHGVKSALIRYTSHRDGWEMVSSISFKPMVWQDVDAAVRCPDCGAPMGPAESNPFAERRRDD